MDNSKGTGAKQIKRNCIAIYYECDNANSIDAIELQLALLEGIESTARALSEGCAGVNTIIVLTYLLQDVIQNKRIVTA